MKELRGWAVKKMDEAIKEREVWIDKQVNGEGFSHLLTFWDATANVYSLIIYEIDKRYNAEGGKL